MEKIDSREKLIKLVQQYQNLIFSICLKLTGDYFAAEDLTQETFLAAYRHLEEFDGEAEKAWLCRIAGNKCIDYRRAAGRRMVPTEEEEMHGEELISTEDPLKNVLNQEVLEELKSCCLALPPPYDEVARRHFIDGQPAGEIAQQTGIGVNTVKTRIYRARELLKQSFRKEMLQG